MKKLLAALLTGCMLLAPLSVMAEEGSLDWETMSTAEGAEELVAAGNFVTLDEVSFKMWVPDVMPAVELTDEDKEQGFIAYFQTEDESAVASVVSLAVDMTTLEEYKSALETTEGVAEVGEVVINGNPAVSYDMPDQDTTCVAFMPTEGQVLEFAFAPLSDEGYQAIIAMMGASIMNA